MKYFARIGDRRYECRIEVENGATFLVVDGRRLRADLEHLPAAGAYSLLLDGRSFEFDVHDRGEGEVELSGAAGLFRVTVEDERTHAARAKVARKDADGPHTIRSAMPGIVRELLVQEGASVEKGTALLILEAMKMQNEVRAEHPGTVGRIHVEAGRTVEKGEPLVDLE